MRRWLPVIALLAALIGSAALLAGQVPCSVLELQPACEVAMRPGPTEDALELVAIEGAPVFAPDGQLRLTTVAVDDDLDLLAWLRARSSAVVDAVPRSRVFPPGLDRDQVAEQNAALMADSQLTAAVVALEHLGYELEGRGALVAAVTADAVTDELAAGDVILAAGGRATAESTEVVEVVRARSPGEQLALVVRGEDGEERDVTVTLGRNPDDAEVAYIGILLTTDLDLPVDIDIDAGVIGGPSAGLIFALSIVELLGEEDLTGGAVVAGSGAVARDGSVGAVGGVRQKLVGATSPRGDTPPATVFLVPTDNLDEAASTPVENEVLVVPVESFDAALLALADLRAGRTPAQALARAPGD